MKVNSIIPKFGENYDVGYIGFTFYDNSFVSRGIAYFERWNRISDITVSHAFVVTGDNELVEAHITHGVQRDSINKYFDDPHVHVFFRKPVAWDRVNAQIIATAAANKIGCKYDSGLIAAEAMADSFVGHWLNTVFRRWPNRIMSRCLNRPNRFICSELAAYALSQVMELYQRGILADPLDMIDPQELFEDTEIFEDWVNASGHGPTLNKL